MSEALRCCGWRTFKVKTGCRTHWLSCLEVAAFTDDSDILCFILNYSPGSVISESSKMLPPKRKGGTSGYDKDDMNTFFFFFAFFKGCTYGIWRFPDEGSHPR